MAFSIHMLESSLSPLHRDGTVSSARVYEPDDGSYDAVVLLNQVGLSMFDLAALSQDLSKSQASNILVLDDAYTPVEAATSLCLEAQDDL